MPKCNCAGQSCGCLVVGDNGIVVTGTGTAADPFVVAADLGGLGIASALAVSSSTSIEFGLKGAGTNTDPAVITGQVVVRDANGVRWTLAVDTSGNLSTVLAGPAPTGATSGGTTVVQNAILYFNGTAWDTRGASQGHAIYCSLGYTGVPTPPGFKAGDTWLCEAQ